MAFKQIFRIAFITLVWKQYKGLIVSTALLIAFILLVGNIHQDFLAHQQLQDKASNNGMSFVYKWAAYAVGVVLYLLFHLFKRSSPTKSDLSEKAQQANLAAKDDADDPFAAIRTKDKLRSRADFIEQEKS